MTRGPSERVGVVIQARTGSSRLPGKVLMSMGGVPILAHVVRSARRADRPTVVVVATTFLEADDPVAVLAAAEGAEVVRGAEDDCLGRFVQATLRHDLDAVVRLTADNPLVDPRDVDRAIELLEAGPSDYVDNIRGSGYPLGLCVEAFRRDALLEAFARSDDPAEHEHVTPYLYSRPGAFRTATLSAERDLSHLRVTVDTEEDFERVAAVLERMSLRSPGPDHLLQLRELERTAPELFPEEPPSRRAPQAGSPHARGERP